MEFPNLGPLPQIMSLAGVGIAITLSNPFDLVRFRLQTMPELVKQGTLRVSYKGLVDCMKRVRRE